MSPRKSRRKAPAVPAALLRPEQFYREAFERAPDALLLIDPVGKVVEANQVATRLPVPRPPRSGDPFVFLWPRSVRPAIAQWLEQLEQGEPGQLLEIPLNTPNGDQVLELMVWTLTRETPPQRLIMIRDITERVRLAERALHSERLASVGRLAATLAHEIRNTLAGIDGALQVFQSADDLPASRREIVAEMRDRIARTREVVDDLLAFSRPPRLDRHPFPVAEVLQAMRDSAAGQPEMEDVSVLGVDDCDPADRVAVDAFNIRLVARNLILNAAQAMGGRGQVTIHARKRGDRVLFVFHDQGPGIPPELRDRIFEPFFTTRSEGTGLGLPIAANIVEAHGGRLYLELAGPGARFTLSLPIFTPLEPDDESLEDLPPVDPGWVEKDRLTSL